MKVKNSLFVVVYFFVQATAFSQSNSADYIGGTLAFGDGHTGFSFAYWHNWHVGKRKKIELGAGLRATSFFGSDIYYATAPAKLTSGSTGPGVLFKENIDANIDSLLIGSPSLGALNVMINIGYRFNEKWAVGFNIDAIGFSFGSKKGATYVNGNTVAASEGEPTDFNLLLVSDNDKGTLNSELYVQYSLSSRWRLRGAAQFLFTEYTTATKVQQFPEPNDRFRDKALMFSVGAAYKIQ
jgi:hypothetical protein